MDSHNETIVDQFSRQASAFAAAPAIRSEAALALLLDACDPAPDDEVLDVACGPGIVVCAFAERVRRATGVDLTPAMLARGRELALSSRVENTSFLVADVAHLPFGDAAFSVVTSRYAFHHFVDPACVLKEMVRVCRPGGRVAVMDMVASDDPDKAARFNLMERTRDPSHVAALTLSELARCLEDAGLANPAVSHYRMTVELDALLRASFPDPGGARRVREMVLDSITGDGMGVGTNVQDGKVCFRYPIALLVSTLPA